ncbi:uncharacterized protein LOC131210260 [Anopheles bellator]|uniref:uncharacterized protein LOC131210260 n=1 Tax=Anopheles bellator TaxID=139047 RepID=UPI002647E4E4|nr:uncharacterized protein LOC131210260 [Anopheles bellator]
MYTDYIPAFEKMYRDRGVEVQFAPRCLKSCQGIPADVLVLDDMTNSGCRMANRRAGLDLKHTELALDLLAKFHAASAVYVDHGHTLTDEFIGPKPIEGFRKMGKDFLQPMLDGLMQYMAHWDLEPDYYDDLKELTTTVIDDLADMVTPRENQFNVLIHGDLWTNNMVFKYEANSSVPLTSTLLDFQICCWTSPLVDLHSFLFSSVSSDLMLTKLNYFLRYYQERLAESLVLLGYTKRLPTLQQLHADFTNHLLFGLLSAMMMLPFVLVPETADASLDTIVDTSTDAGQRFQKQMLDNDQLRTHLKMLIPYFRVRGIPRPTK